MPATRSPNTGFRQVVRRQACPTCKAAVGRPCVEDGQVRTANHQARVDLTTKGNTSYWRRQRTRK